MKKTISLLLAILLCLGLTPPAHADNQPFGDVSPGFWAIDAILEAYNDGVMTGTGKTEMGIPIFTPSGKLNMAQFVTVLTRAFYNEEVKNSIRYGDWPNQNYDVAEKHDLFTGLVRWGRDVEVTRAVMAQMMYNVMVDQGTILPNENEIQSTLNQIPDISTVDGNYKTAVAVCYYLNLLSGVDANGTFSPQGVLNRAQTAVIYVRLKKAIGVLSDGTANPSTTNPGETSNSSGATLINGMPVTEENVQALIEEYKNGKEPGKKARDAGFTSYVDMAHYDAYNPKYRIVLPNGPINGTECAKFAYAFFDDIFGEDAPIREVTNPADVRPGDLIQSPGHWWIAVEKAQYDTEYDFYWAHPVGGGPSGEIDWGNIGLNLNNATAIYTRYPE